MSTVLFSKTFVEKINAIIRRFWWAGVQDDNPSNPIAFRSWDDICQPIDNGGLAIRDLFTVGSAQEHSHERKEQEARRRTPRPTDGLYVGFLIHWTWQMNTEEYRGYK